MPGTEFEVNVSARPVKVMNARLGVTPDIDTVSPGSVTHDVMS